MNYKTQYYFWPLIIILYFATRLINLSILPIFTDEAIYSYWAQVALHDPANRYISLEDGKQPLFIWLAAISQKFINDPLIASRVVSVFAGLGSMIGIYLLSKKLFDQKTAKIASILYLVLPFTLLYDRLALFDSLLTMLGIWASLSALYFVRNLQLDTALVSGVVLGLGLITKSSANFFVYLLPVSLLFFDFKKKNSSKNLLKWAALISLTVIISQLIYNSLRLSPLFYLIARKNLSFIRSPSEVLASPFANFAGNFDSIITWLNQYHGWPLTLLAIATMIWGIYKFNRPVLFLSAYILTPLVAELFFNKVLYPRFALFYYPYIIIIISVALIAIYSLKKYSIFVKIIILALFIFPAFSSFYLLTNPPKSQIADADKNQYINDWPAGYGVKEVVEVIKSDLQTDNVYVGTEGTFGLLPRALQIYFYGVTGVQFQGFWPVGEIPAQVTDAAKTQKTYFVYNENQKEVTNLKLKLVDKYKKGNGNSYLRLYEVIP